MRPIPSRLVPIAALLLWADPSPSPAADKSPGPASSPSPGPWTIVRRSIGEGRATNRYWQVDYTLRNDGPTPVELKPEQVGAEVDGWVSNSRVAGHASPRRSRVAASTGASASCDVIPSGDESRRCRERAVLQAWPADRGDNPPEPAGKAAVRLVSVAQPPATTIPPGGSLRVRLTLEHDHFLYGPHDPLLGPRKLDLTLGSSRLGDTLPLDRETKLPKCAATTWPSPGDPPADRLDTRLFVSAPSSLHLQAHVPGEHSYRFKECNVRYSTRMRLRYYYLIAPGSEGECKARIVQYKDAPTAWKILSDGDVDQTLEVVGRWVKVERTFRTEPEATTLTLEFCVRGDIGEMWIDDVSLEPAEDDAGGP